MKDNNLYIDDDDAKESGSEYNADAFVDPKYLALLKEMKKLKESMKAPSFQTTACQFNRTIKNGAC